MRISKKALSIASQTKSELDAGSFTVDGCVFRIPAKTKSCDIHHLPESVLAYTGEKRPGYIRIWNSDVVMAAYNTADIYNSRTCLLNFASAWTPGGGWLKGANAQEEGITMRSTLFNSIGSPFAWEKYYAVHRSNDLPYNLNATLYSPFVWIYKDSDGNNITPRVVGVYTCAAVDYRTKHQRITYPARDVGEALMYQRICAIVADMARQGYTHIHLGAWGCGVFRNDPQKIAEAFYHVLIDLGYRHAFQEIYFDIHCKHDTANLDVFKSVFKQV